MSRRLLTVAALTAVVTAGLAWAVTLDYLSDDAFITFRYARNLARGAGLVYNPGERVEGYTNFLEVVILAGLHRLGADLVRAGRALGLVSAAAAVVLTWALGRRTLAREKALALAAAALVAANPFLAAWAGAGLETTLFTALLLATALCLLVPRLTATRFLAGSGLGLLLAWTRPEGVALYGVLAACAAAAAGGSFRQRARVLWPGLALFASAGAIYFAGRWAYFGDPLPNTFYVKSAFTLRHVERGTEYLLAYVAHRFVLWSLPLCAVGAWTALRHGLWPLLALPLAVLGIVVAEGGDGLPMYRFLVPAVPLLALLAALGGEAVSERLGRLPGLALGLSLLAMACAFSFFPNRDQQVLSYLYQRNYEVPTWSATGRALRAVFPPGTTVALVPIGAVGYYSDLPVIDMAGLTDRTIAKGADPRLGSGWAGHEKHNGRYVLSRRPGVLLLGNVHADSQPTLPAGTLLPSSTLTLEREGDVLSDPAFQGGYEMQHIRLDTGSWLHCFVRRDLVTPGPP